MGVTTFEWPHEPCSFSMRICEVDWTEYYYILQSLSNSRSITILSLKKCKCLFNPAWVGSVVSVQLSVVAHIVQCFQGLNNTPTFPVWVGSVASVQRFL